MMVKSALMTTASTLTNEDNPIPGGYFDYGAGQVVPNSAYDPGLVYDAGWNDWLAFLCETSTAVSTGTCNALAGLGYSLDPSDLNYPSIAIGALPGAQTVTHTVTNVSNKTEHYIFSAAVPGIDVVADPAAFTVQPGDSVSYTITFTVNGAVLDTYTSGFATWTGNKGHIVRSPVALRPVKLAAPAEIAGAGIVGSLDFD